jgi:hypothetical protein
MEEVDCPFCSEPMDVGSVHVAHGAGYVSRKQRGILKSNTMIESAQACTSCGFVAMFVDVGALRRNTS